MQNPAVSVVIPAYNAAKFITRTLDSVASQTWKDFEVIVVDDGSKDDTAQVVASYINSKGLNACCIVQPNARIAAARNTGMRAATGKYIALLDHDDFWYPRKLEVCMKELSDHPEADMVCSKARMVTETGEDLGVLHTGPNSATLYEDLIFRRNMITPSFTVFLREKALAIGGFRENPEYNTVEDYDFWVRFSKHNRVHFTAEVLGEYLVMRNSASRNLDYHINNLLAVTKDHLKDYFGPNPGFSGRMRIKKRLLEIERIRFTGKIFAFLSRMPLLESAVRSARKSFYQFKVKLRQ